MNSEAYMQLEHPAESDGLETINLEVLDQLVIKSKAEPERYPFSKALDIIHRTLPEADVSKYSGAINRGQKLENSEVINTVPANMEFTDAEGRKVIFNNVEFPRNKLDIFNSLDHLAQELDWENMSEREVLEASAFFCLISATTHPYLDANGRASVGGAKFLIDKNISGTLDLNILNNHNETLMELMSMSTLSLMPEEFNPIDILATLEPGASTIVDMSNMRVSQEQSTSIVGQIDLTAELEENIQVNIDRYRADPKEFAKEALDYGLTVPHENSRMPNSRLQEITEKLADLFETCVR